MADVAASVLARLKNKATESGRSYQLCLQLFCQEEFLRRLEKSKYAENLVLKGGLFLYSLTNFDSRVTVDVDFLLRQILILSRLVDTFFSRISLTMQLSPKPHNTAYVLPWEEGLHWQSRSSGCSSN